MYKPQCKASAIDNDPSAIVTVQSILYDYYVNNHLWKINDDNPSGIRIKKNKLQKIIVDDYDAISTWFSAMTNKDVHACARLCREDNECLLEIERYPNAQKKLAHIFEKKKQLNLVELNREAIQPKDVQNVYVYLSLLQAVFKHCVLYKNSILTTSNLDEWVKVYDLIKFPKMVGSEFKYTDLDEKEVNVYFASQNQIKNILARINLLLQE